MIQSVIAYFRESRAELKRVNWPTKELVKSYTLLVILLSLATALFLGGLDSVFGWALKTFIL